MDSYLKLLKVECDGAGGDGQALLPVTEGSLLHG